MKVMFRQGPSRHVPIPGKVPVGDLGHEVSNNEPLRPASDLTVRWKVTIGRRRRSSAPHPVRRRRQRLNLWPINGGAWVGGVMGLNAQEAGGSLVHMEGAQVSEI